MFIKIGGVCNLSVKKHTEEMDVTVPYWKRVWKTVACGKRRVPNSLVTQVLNEVGDDLCKGVRVYNTPFTENDCKAWLAKINVEEFDEDFEKFFIRLCKYLNLKADSGWAVLCNYLLYEYHGKLSSIKQSALYEPFATKLLESICHFYYSERMFLLKTLRYILEQFDNPKHTDVFHTYMQKVTWRLFWDSILEQLDHLIKELTKETMKNTQDLKAWIERNAQEQLEVVLTTIAGMAFQNFTINHFIPMLVVFTRNDFGRPSPYVRRVHYDEDVFNKLCTAQVGAFFIFLQKCWDNKNFWIQQKDELQLMISMAANVRGYNVMALGWAFLLSYTEDGDEEVKSSYTKTIVQLLETRVLEKIYCLLQIAREFNSLPGRMITKAVYTFMNLLCHSFNSDGLISLRHNTYEIMHELLKDTELCANLMLKREEEPIYSILNFGEKFFPYNFEGLTLILISLVEKDFTIKAIQYIKQLKTYAEEYSGALTHDARIRISHEYNPVPSSKSVRIPAETMATAYARFGKVLVIYDLQYDYYSVVVSFLDTLTHEIQEKKAYTKATFQKLLLGLKLIAAVLKSGLIDMSSLDGFLKHLKLVYHIFGQGKFQNHEMMIVFYQLVYGALLSGIKDRDKFWSPRFLPELTNTSLEIMLGYYEVLTPSDLLELLHVDDQTDDHKLLFIYIDSIMYAARKNVLFQEIQLPGIVHLFRWVFPKHTDFQYKNPLEKYRLTNKVLEIILFIVMKNPEDINNDDERLVYNYCIDTVLTDLITMKAWMELFTTTIFTAEQLLLKETNWERKENVIINRHIGLVLQTTLLLMKVGRHMVTSNLNKVIHFEYVILHPPLERFNTIKVIAAFADYVFDHEIQKASIRTLQNLALDSSFSLLGPMDLEPFQLQSFFLDKLRDPVESDDFKLAIIHFIRICIDHQPGLTNAFFNVNIAPVPFDDADTVISCMVDFLRNVEESKVCIHHPLLCGILSLMHKVWDTGRSHLIETITRLKDFWSTLVKPLYFKFTENPHFYALCVGVLAQEFLLSKSDVSKEFSAVVKDLLDPNKKFIHKWSTYLIEVSRRVKTVREVDRFGNVALNFHLQLIHSWKIFVNYGQMHVPDFFKDSELRMIIAETCLDGLLAHFTVMTEQPCINFWSELYIICMKEWSADSFKNVKEMFHKIGLAITNLNADYKYMDEIAKQCILSAASMLLSKFKDFANENPTAVHEILQPLGRVFRYEFYALSDDARITCKGEVEELPSSYSTWLLILSIINKVLTLEHIGQHRYWFAESRFLDNVLCSVGPFVQCPKALPYAKFAIKTLIIYSKSPFVYDFLRADKSYFFKETMPPVEYVHPPLKLSAVMREWWVTYAEIFKLINYLIFKLGNAIREDILCFLNFHDDAIISVLDLTRITAEPAALNLICCVLMFLNNMLAWKGRWIITKEHYFTWTVEAIKNCISGACHVILRPKCLFFASILNRENILPDTCMPETVYLDIFHMILEIITLGMHYFIKCIPNLLFLNSIPTHTFGVVRFEKDFFVPKYTQGELNIFTYGGVLCIMHLLCRTFLKLKEYRRKNVVPKGQKLVSRTTLEEVLICEKSITEKDTIDSPSCKFEPYIAIILTLTDADYVVHEKISSLQRSSASCFDLFEASWFYKLNYQVVQMALEKMSYFVMLEILMELHTPGISPQVKEYIKKEISSEMQFFSDFVRKTMHESMESTRIYQLSLRGQVENQRISIYMTKLLESKDAEFDAEFFWVLNHIIQDNCQEEEEEDDNPLTNWTKLLSKPQKK